MREAKFALFFYTENPGFKSTFQCCPLLQKWDIQKQKSENHAVKMKMALF